VFTSCGRKESGYKQSGIPDTMISTHGDSVAIAARFTGDYEHFLAVIDSLVDVGELSQIRADGYRGVGYFQLGQIDKCLECLRSAIASDNPPASDFWSYIHAGGNLVIILNSQRNYDTAMRTALRLIEHLKQVDTPIKGLELQTLYLCLGDTQMMLGRNDEAVESYKEAYKWVQSTPNNPTSRPLAACFETLENIAVTHINHHMDEAGTWVDRMDSLLAVYEVQPKADSNEVKTFHALVLLHRAQVCQMRGQEAQATRYYAQFDSTDYGKSIEGRINGCDYLVEARRYAEAADNYALLDRFVKEWGYEYDLETIGKNLLPKLRSNYFAGRKDSALRVAMQIAEVYDSALVQQKQRDAAELATIYDTQGKERQIAEHKARSRMFAVISVAITFVALLVIAFTIYVFRQWRATKEKNRILAQQITEALEYKEKLRAQKLMQTATDENTPGAGDSVSDLTTLTDEQLFIYLRDLIENERMFLQSDFGRQTLIDRTGLSKERIGAAFAQGSDSNSLPAYVRELRLDYAIRLMNDQPDIAVEQVSQASGFTSADTFTRNFRTKYGMTPTAYKQTKISE
jgi:AraC-like DNA-binding protein